MNFLLHRKLGRWMLADVVCWLLLSILSCFLGWKVIKLAWFEREFWACILLGIIAISAVYILQAADFWSKVHIPKVQYRINRKTPARSLQRGYEL